MNNAKLKNFSHFSSTGTLEVLDKALNLLFFSLFLFTLLINTFSLNTPVVSDYSRVLLKCYLTLFLQLVNRLPMIQECIKNSPRLIAKSWSKPYDQSFKYYLDMVTHLTSRSISCGLNNQTPPEEP